MAQDQFENIIYRTEQTASTTKIVFVSQAFYSGFVSKMESDFSSSIIIDRTSFISKCTTHVQGLKCDVSMDSHFKTVCVTGVGHMTWKECRFPMIARSLFKRFIAQADELSRIDQDRDQHPDSENSEYVAIPSTGPIHTSTPFVQRQDGVSLPTTPDGGDSRDSQLLTLLVEKISQMEKDIRVMKTALITCMDKISTAPSYAAVTAHRIPASGEPAMTISTAGSPATSIEHRQEVHQPAPQSARDIPVVISSRPPIVPTTPDVSSNRNTQEVAYSERSETNQENKTVLLIGDSILKGINTRGLKWDVQKHSTGGATLPVLMDEILRYDMRVFSHVIIYVGGNDAANQIDIELFEDKYDQLIDKIKRVNSDCNITLCQIAPRGDVDVANINTSIARLAAHWTQLYVKCADTHDLFLD